MTVAGLAPVTVVLFVAYGLVVGLLFGFFGMGGSFLVTPTLLVVGYPTTTAVGTGLAFVFGTSATAALKHRDLGQIDYRLAGVMVVAMTAGVEVGKRLVDRLVETGAADEVISTAYVVVLAGVGAFVVLDARDALPTFDAGRLPAVPTPRPRVSFLGGAEASAWFVLGLGFAVGVLSGVLGVGGGFLLVPAMLYGVGVPAAVAVGTNALQITVSAAYGAFRYAGAGGVALPVAVSLLAGSSLGARLGSAATEIVDGTAIRGYFGALLLAAAVAVAARHVGSVLGVRLLVLGGAVLIVGASVAVAGAVAAVTVPAVVEG